MAHIGVTGITRSGKSYYAAELGRTHKGPVLCIDPQDSSCWPWPRASGQNESGEVLEAARAGGVVFVPSWDDRRARAQVALLLAEVMAQATGKGRPWLIIADEAHLYAPEGGPPGGLHLVARRGLRWGVWGCFVSQRPQDIAKAVLSQCDRQVIFRSEFSSPYWSKYGIPSEEVQARLLAGQKKYSTPARLTGGGPWPYVVWEGGALSGPFHA